MPYGNEYGYGQYTPLDNTLAQYNVFKSAYKNIRFGVRVAQKITLTAADAANLPGLSFRLYNTPNLWRGLLAVNGLNDAISDVVVGMSLNIPPKSDLIAYLAQQQSNSNPTLNI